VSYCSKGEPEVIPTKGETEFKGYLGKGYLGIDIYSPTNGTKGDKGDKGDTGASGTNGTKGDKGDTGASGTNGTNGVKGDTGASGTNGTNGDKGDTGASGTNGTKGDKGDTGASGINGTNGTKGDKGDPSYTSVQIIESTSGDVTSTLDVSVPIGSVWISPNATDAANRTFILPDNAPAGYIVFVQNLSGAVWFIQSNMTNAIMYSTSTSTLNSIAINFNSTRYYRYMGQVTVNSVLRNVWVV
jgi:hypothetical protein